MPDGFHEVPAHEVDRDPQAQPPPIDWTPLVDAARQVANWMLDVARSRTADPTDLTAIDRVQAAARASLDHANVRAAVTEQDLLTVLGILIEAFEVDCQLPGLGALAGSLYDAADDAPDVRTLVDLIMRDAAQQVARQPRRAATPARFVVLRRGPRVAHTFDDDAASSARRAVLIIR